jgi:hypothetical protein
MINPETGCCSDLYSNEDWSRQTKNKCHFIKYHHYHRHFAGFGVLTVVIVNDTVLWVVIPFNSE